ncbi:hypothetical protein SDRG_00435 [Saprolegnia diclina VS20]|uniref:C2 domain-containing protein n=1 Tax=Saprolegnia diclina (strain VS20) TaxID=1156394 RepID=T0SBC1_SAPDV|nr:hypothetical protein SDRG_00435 [Saprolegnia diclina VS20]EQC42708.1 hypothetical protein SDRG_00435 [Saprolegnia diclina VS20]|eukprot:XP_008604131.1 hypothetical protein SDRG_00435 [Saprolegnia diclina VS20]
MQGGEKADAAARVIQRMARCHAARRFMQHIATSVYRKCYDESSGLYYFCNLRTGDTAWDRPRVFSAAVDAPFFVDPALAADDKATPAVEGNDDAALPIQTRKMQRDELARLRQEGLALVARRADAKASLEASQRKKVHQGRKAWEKRCLQQNEEARMERRRQVANENKQLLQTLLDGTYKPQLGSIRDACMRGDVARVNDLLQQGFSANAESAMGLTPLLAACSNGQLAVVQLLLGANADVNHRHVITQRTPYMEACERANAPILRELLRAGARLHWRDKQNRCAADGIIDATIRAMHEAAATTWTPTTNGLFPTPFRKAGLALAFVAKCQATASTRAQKRAVRAASATRIALQKRLVECKVRYDTEKRHSDGQVVLIRRRATMDTVDERFDGARAAILIDAEDAVLARRRATQPRALLPSDLFRILSYCSRHWFDTKAVRSQQILPAYVPMAPSRVRISTSVPSRAVADQLAANAATMDAICAEMLVIEATQAIDPVRGVSCLKASGESQAAVRVTILEARHLPRRVNRQLINPFVRVRILETSGKVVVPFEATDPRFDDEWPSWDHALTMPVPSIYCEMHVQVVDHASGRPELAGEVRLPLRSYLDQKEHDEWLTLPPTLKQQLLEGPGARTPPATLHVLVAFTHAKGLVLYRALHAAMRTRQVLLEAHRASVKAHLEQQLAQLETPT